MDNVRIDKSKPEILMSLWDPWSDACTSPTRTSLMVGRLPLWTMSGSTSQPEILMSLWDPWSDACTSPTHTSLMVGRLLSLTTFTPLTKTVLLLNL